MIGHGTEVKLLFEFCSDALRFLLRFRLRLRPQSYCRSVADKYIEWEFVLIAIDLVLHRVQAYRHLLFNMRPFSTHSFHVRDTHMTLLALYCRTIADLLVACFVQ